jgi:hypothetical protein
LRRETAHPPELPAEQYVHVVKDGDKGGVEINPRLVHFLYPSWHGSGMTMRLVRTVAVGSYLESFLISAVAAVTVIRVILQVTGFPQLGRGGLHISHMLWGGLLMLVAIILLLSFLGTPVRRVAGLLGGLGFGTFVDEVGKFITSDNNYFFKPAVSLIYVIFILLFLLMREIVRRRGFSSEEYLVNAADAVVDVLLGGATRAEVVAGVTLLRQSGSDSAVAAAILQAVLASPRIEEAAPSFLSRVSAFLGRSYAHLVAWPWFQRVIVGIFVVGAIDFVVGAVYTIVVVASARPSADEAQSVADVGLLVSSLIESILVVTGAIRLLWSRLDGYRWFRRAILVWIFLVQVFLVYQNQVVAGIALVIALLLLVGLDYMIDQERSEHESLGVGSEESRVGRLGS